MARAKNKTTAEREHQESLLKKIAVESNENNSYMMGFEMTVKQFTISSLCQKYKKGELDFDADMQRGLVWNKARASLYIHSLLLGLSPYQSPFLMNKKTNEDGRTVYEVLDGKQRGLPAIIRYIENEYALCGLANEPCINYGGIFCNINGKRFSQLPEEIQEELKTTSIPAAVSFNATARQKSLIFSRANNYKAMSKFDLARASKKDMSDILSVASHQLFKKMYGEKKLDSLDYQKLIVESWIVENEGEPIITGTHINKVMSELSMSEEEQKRLKDDYDMILNAYKFLHQDHENDIIKIIFNSTHFISYLAFVEKFPNNKTCAEWFKQFYSNIPEEYLATTKSQSNNTTNLKTRMEIVENSINDFLENYENLTAADNSGSDNG